MYNDEIKHHGILGQKWGIRRYQNPDGSLTPAGRKRAQKLKGEYRELTGKKLKGKIPKEDPNKKSIKNLNDTELSNRVKRLENEKRARDLERELSSNGSKVVRSVGKDIMGPAAIEAGKKLMSKMFYDYGSKALGLDKNDMKDEYKALKRSAEMAEFRNRKDKAEKEFKSRLEREKQKQAESKKNQNDSDWEFIGNDQSYKKYKSSGKDHYDNVFDAEFKETPSNSTALTIYKKKGQSWFDRMYN